MPTTFANTIDGNEILAKRSQCDYAGNDIQQTYATKSEVTTGLSGKQDTISDLATIRSGAAAGATAVQPADLATVATTGAYSDLTGTPTIPSGVELVPAATSADANKVLTVDAQGIPAWETPSGGGTAYAAGKGIDISNDTVSVITGSGLSIGSNTAGSSGPALGYSSAIKGIKAKTRWSYYSSSSPVQLHVVLENIYDRTKYAVAKTPYTCRLVYGVYVLDVGDIIPFSYDIADYDTYGGFDSVSACNIFVTRVGSTEGLAPNGEQYIYASEYLLEVLYNLDVYVERPLPSSTSGDSGKVLTVNSSGSPVWATPSGGGSVTDVEVNGTSVVNASGVAEVTVPSGTQLVPAATSADADKVLTVDSQGTPAWSTPAPGGVTDVEVDGTSVVSGGVASITMPTVDQTYNSASTNAQSGVAVAGALATKQDTISDLATIRSGAADGATAVQPGDLATVATSGSYNDLSNTPTILPYKPVVAGTGVRIVDDTANNRIVVEADETVLWANTSGVTGAAFPITLSEAPSNFERIRLEFKPWTARVMEFEFPGDETSFLIGSTWSDLTMSNIYNFATIFTVNSLTLEFVGNKYIKWGSTTISSDSSTFRLYKVVGVHRIASN